MLELRIAPQSEVIRAILLEDSPCCGGGARTSISCIAFLRSVMWLVCAMPAIEFRWARPRNMAWILVIFSKACRDEVLAYSCSRDSP